MKAGDIKLTGLWDSIYKCRLSHMFDESDREWAVDIIEDDGGVLTSDIRKETQLFDIPADLKAENELLRAALDQIQCCSEAFKPALLRNSTEVDYLTLEIAAMKAFARKVLKG